MPVISKSQIDEKLLEAGSKLEKYNTDRTQNIMQLFVNKDSSIVSPFIDSINTINYLHNNQIEILFDNENIYLDKAVI